MHGTGASADGRAREVLSEDERNSYRMIWDLGQNSPQWWPQQDACGVEGQARS